MNNLEIKKLFFLKAACFSPCLANKQATFVLFSVLARNCCVNLKIMLLGRQQKGSLQKGKLNLLIKCRKIFDLWGILPYDYSKKEKSFFVKPNKKIRQLRWKFWLSLWFTLVSFLQTVYLWSTLSLPQLLQCWFYIFFTACGCYTIYDQVNNCHEIVALLNGMVAFEKAHPQGNSKYFAEKTPFLFDYGNSS